MTYDEYWRGPAELPKYYRQAHELQTERENIRDWRMGLYIRDAIMACMPFPVGFAKGGARPRPYPTEPYSISEKQDKAKAEAKARAQYNRMKDKMMAKMKAQKVRGGEVNAD